ncbi:hypothetical protein [Edaphobacter aggregans]|uniref:hypothetical protein n=1 Tax=Edaphobacter aggregans TaxID=570835 RepID=UPI0005574154|nr:hypothetical protein [Edaphobacter aggregans]
MAKPPVKPDRDSASDADWQMARHREDALKVLLETSSPAAVAEVAADLRLSSAMVDRLLAVYRRDPSTSSLLPNRGGRASGTKLLSTDVETVIPDVDLRVLLEEAAAACRRSPPADHPGMPKGQTCTSFVQSGVGSGQLCRPSAHSS